MKRTTPIKRSNPARKKKAHAAAFGPPGFVEFCHSRGCTVAREHGPADRGCAGPIEVAHIVSRGAGGTWRDTVPLCTSHHREQHDLGILTFANKYALDLGLWADATAHQFEITQ